MQKGKDSGDLLGTVHWPETLAHRTTFTYVVSKYSLISNSEFLFIHLSNQYRPVLCVSHLIFALYKPDTMGIPLQAERENIHL